MSLLEQDSTKKEQMDENDATELDIDNSNKYKVEVI